MNVGKKSLFYSCIVGKMVAAMLIGKAVDGLQCGL